MAQPYLSEIQIFGFDFAPKNWAQCNGQILPIAQNQALFSLLGTAYGGNGTTTFALPDLRGRVPVHMGQGAGLSPFNMGQVGGSETHTLTVQQLPAHSHQVKASAAVVSQPAPGGNLWAKGASEPGPAPIGGRVASAGSPPGACGA